MLPSFMTSGSSDDASSDEEAAEAERQAILLKKKKEDEATMKRRRDAREAFESGRFAKAEKIEKDTFGEILQRKTFVLSSEDKAKFKQFIPRVVAHFDRDGVDFPEKMEKIRTGFMLINFVNVHHKTLIADAENPENIEMHNFLVIFHKEIFSALREMTSIPKDAVLNAEAHGNVFVEARENFLKEEAVQKDLLEGFEEKARKAREVERKTHEAVTDELVGFMRELSLVPNADEDLLQMLAKCSLDDMAQPCRDTSPPRNPLPPSMLEQAIRAVAHLMVSEETRTGEPPVVEEPDSDNDDFSNFLKARLADMPVPERQAKVEEEVEEEGEDPDDGLEVEIEGHEDWRETLGSAVECNPMYFGITPSESDMEDWRKQRFEDKHKKKKLVKLREKKGIQFAPFGSPLNTMRIFVKPLGHFFVSGDDGPRTDHVDLTLKQGWKTIIRKNKEPPLILKTPETLPMQVPLDHVAQRLTNTFDPSLKKYHGNLLGRFWFLRDPETDEMLHMRLDMSDYDYLNCSKDVYYQFRRDKGYLRQYTMRELTHLYTNDLDTIHRFMKRGLFRIPSNKENDDGTLARVLILTDWRLGHLNTACITNAVFKYLPTNLGAAFFDSMAEYVCELLMSPNIEIDTIIFAFGGSPRFKKECFLAFFKRMTVHTLKRVDVFWTAQDWWDGLPSTVEQRREMDEFNCYVKSMFDVMKATGYRNYKWFNVREEMARANRPIPPIDSRQPLVETQLEPIYSAYIDLFVKKCNCYAQSYFWMRRNRHYDRHPENKGHYPCVSERGSHVFLPFKS